MQIDRPFAWQFLVETSSRERLLQAMVENMRQWVARCAQSNEGEVNGVEDVTWVFSPGPEGDAAILFPRLTPQNASAQLDSILHYFRQRQPERDLLCWSLDPTQPEDLEARLLARGFDWNWSPHWMALDLQKLPEVPAVPGLHIEIVERVPLWEVEDLPYYSPTAAAHLHRTTQQVPRSVWHFAAWLDGQVVGQSRLNLTSGELGVAGIFDVGVVPGVRSRGIGKALTLAACRLAQSLGCRYALLNASGMGEPVYRRLGFISLGYGKTWLLRRTALTTPSGQEQIAFVEALGQGRIDLLNALKPQLSPALYCAPLPSGLLPLQIAVGLRQPASAQWLIEQGVPLDLLSAWDLGWRERAERMLRADPALASLYVGPRLLTPVHVAVERNDQELLLLLLSAGPDLTLKDNDFQATALDWARYLNRIELARLIELYQLQRQAQ